MTDECAADTRRRRRLSVPRDSCLRAPADRPANETGPAALMLRGVTAARALVVGASSDIGRSIAVELASSGHAVIGWGRRRDALGETVDACRAVGADASAAVVDVIDDTAVRSGVRRLNNAGPLHVVVWAAGLFDWARADQADSETWRELLQVNLAAPAVFTALVAPLLVRSAPSSLIFIGSQAGHQAFGGNAAYVASKHGLVGLARATFLDLRDKGVKVSLISPGLVAAGAGLASSPGRDHPERLLAPTDVAAAVGYVVASSAACCPTEIRLQPLRTP
jgi:NADP-dependent 3-hydroxy acid dehydrogenase YdfG